MGSSHESHITGHDEVTEAANLLVDSVVYYAIPDVPENERLLEIRAAVKRELNGLMRAMARQLAELNGGRKAITPNDLAKRWGISPDKVLGWIRTGQLPAANVAQSTGGRPRYRIEPEDIATFKAKRSVQAPPPSARRRRKSSADVIEFF